MTPCRRGGRGTGWRPPAGMLAGLTQSRSFGTWTGQGMGARRLREARGEPLEWILPGAPSRLAVPVGSRVALGPFRRLGGVPGEVFRNAKSPAGDFSCRRGSIMNLNSESAAVGASGCSATLPDYSTGAANLQNGAGATIRMNRMGEKRNARQDVRSIRPGQDIGPRSGRNDAPTI